MSKNIDEHQQPQASSLHPLQAEEDLDSNSFAEKVSDGEGNNSVSAEEEVIQPSKKSISSMVITFAVLAALIGGISIVSKQFKPASSMDGMEGMKGMSMEEMMRVDGSANSTPVKVESIQPSLMEASVRYTGTVRPYLEVTVYPRVGGQLTEYSAYPGDKVDAGQVLAQLSAIELSTELDGAITEMDAAKADERIARKELDGQRQEIQRMVAESNYLETRAQKNEGLINAGAIARNDFDRQKSEAIAARAATRGAEIKSERMQADISKAQAQVAQAYTKIERLQVIGGYRVITSPIAGIVQERLAEPGVVVQPGMGILKIGDYSKVRLQANVAQQSLAGVEVGSPIVARVVGNKAKTIKGKVTSIFPKAGEETRTVIVEAVVDNPSEQILAGQAVEIQIITARKPNVLSVPQSALTESEGKQAVWVVAGKSAKRKFVTTGLTNGDRVEVTSGLQTSDLAIISGQERLIENASVVAVDDSGQPVASLSSSSTTQGDTQIKLITPQGKATAGDNQLVLEVQDSKTLKPIQVEGLEVSVAMQMKNSAPMSTDVEIKPDGQTGRFKVNTYLGMNGTWDVNVKVKDKSRVGSSSFKLNNRP